MAGVIETSQYPPLLTIGPGPVGNGGVLCGNAWKSRATQAEEVDERGLNDTAMRDE
jgi:hypothetical protein